MFKVLGADGKVYGPVNIDAVAQWANQGRISLQTQVQPEGASEWRPASEFPELQGIFATLRSAAPPVPISAPPSVGGQQQKGLAVTSLVLGILSLICLGPVTGIPAIICGHIAHSRSRRSPGEYGGGVMAITGFILGYASLALTIVFVALYSAMFIPAISQAKNRAEMIHCSNNMKQIGLAFKIWAVDHNDQFPFNVSTNAGGSLELCERGADGFDQNSLAHFLIMSNELSTPKILTCPADTKQAVQDWRFLKAANVSYQVRSGADINETNPQQVLVVCPIHHTILRVDGSVQNGTPVK